MRILDRYLTQQLLTAAAFAVLLLTAILVLGNIFKQLLDLLVNQNVPLETVMAFIAFLILTSSVYTIPWGFLTAVLLVFSKISAENELLAMRGAGLSFPRICAPVFAMAGLFSLLCLWINTDVAPRAQERMNATVLNLATENPIALFGSDQVIEEFPNRKIYVTAKEGEKLYDVHVFEYNDRFQIVRTIFAREGILSADLENRAVRMKLFNSRFEIFDQDEPANLSKLRQGIVMDETTIAISLEELYEKAERRGLSSLTLKELNAHLKELDGDEESKTRTEISKRYSFSLACITFALIGIPLGITTQRKETSAGFGVSLIVAFSYFLFIEVANSLRGHAASHPHLLMWLPNLLFLALGGYLFYRLSFKR
ncbi:MAG: LptF/LptG family permease [Verrucomicrobiia bacterium]